MKKISVLAIAALAAAATMAPLSASATATPPASSAVAITQNKGAIPEELAAVSVDHQRPGACSHAWMNIWARDVPVYSEPKTTARLLNHIGPMTAPCRSMQVGGIYPDWCGRVNTGWVLISLNTYPNQGWIPNECTEDPVVVVPPDTTSAVWRARVNTVQHQRPGACRHAWMRVRTDNLAVRSEPSATAPEIARISNARIYPCRSIQVGGLYRDVCGADNTGWVLIPLLPYPAQGWIPNQCTEDPIL